MLSRLLVLSLLSGCVLGFTVDVPTNSTPRNAQDNHHRFTSPEDIARTDSPDIHLASDDIQTGVTYVVSNTTGNKMSDMSSDSSSSSSSSSSDSSTQTSSSSGSSSDSHTPSDSSSIHSHHDMSLHEELGSTSYSESHASASDEGAMETTTKKTYIMKITKSPMMNKTMDSSMDEHMLNDAPSGDMHSMNVPNKKADEKKSASQTGTTKSSSTVMNPAVIFALLSILATKLC